MFLLAFIVLYVFVGCATEENNQKEDLEKIKQDRTGLDFATSQPTLFPELNTLIKQWHDAQKKHDLAAMQFLGNEITQLTRSNFSEVVNGLSTSNSSIAVAALGFSSDGNDLRAIPYIIEALKTGDEDTKQNAALALGHIGSNQTPMEPLFEALSNKNNSPNLRSMSAYAISQIVQKDKDEGSMPYLLAALNDESIGVKNHAIIALTNINDTQGFSAIANSTIRDPHPAVRYNSLYALVSTGDQKYLPQIVPLLQDETSQIRESAYETLKEWSGKDFGTDIEAWKQWAGVE